jgi:hypothetical protein
LPVTPVVADPAEGSASFEPDGEPTALLGFSFSSLHAIRPRAKPPAIAIWMAERRLKNWKPERDPASFDPVFGIDVFMVLK